MSTTGGVEASPVVASPPIRAGFGSSAASGSPACS